MGVLCSVVTFWRDVTAASVVHATYFNCWNRIRDEVARPRCRTDSHSVSSVSTLTCFRQGISRMEKAYIHCVPFTPTLKVSQADSPPERFPHQPQPTPLNT